MTIIRVLILMLVIWLIIRVIRIKMDKRRISVKKPTKVVDIKQCSYCGVHIPTKDAIQFENEFYCSSKHLDLNTRNNESS